MQYHQHIHPKHAGRGEGRERLERLVRSGVMVRVGVRAGVGVSERKQTRVVCVDCFAPAKSLTCAYIYA